MGPVIIQTERLNLRAWTAEDRPAMQRIGNAPEIIDRLNGGEPLSDEQIDAFIARQSSNLNERGWCRFAIELRSPTPGDPPSPVGFCGFGCNFAPDIELGWTLLPQVWGRGIATEAGWAALHFGFEVVGFPHVISVIALDNPRSQHVAERIGLIRAGQLEHAGLPHWRYSAENPRTPDNPDPRYRRDCRGSGPSLPPLRR